MSNRALAAAAGLLALVVLPAVMRAQAPNAERVAAAKELMRIAGVEKQFDEVMPYMMRQLAQSFTAIAPDKSSEIGDVLGQLTTKFVDRKGELIGEIAALYAERLTPEELAGLIAFYKSPIGMKFVAVQPEIVRQSMVAGQRWGARLGREIEEEARKELKKRGVDL